jgi:hypothetical protein
MHSQAFGRRGLGSFLGFPGVSWEIPSLPGCPRAVSRAPNFGANSCPPPPGVRPSRGARDFFGVGWGSDGRAGAPSPVAHGP